MSFNIIKRISYEFTLKKEILRNVILNSFQDLLILLGLEIPKQTCAGLVSVFGMTLRAFFRANSVINSCNSWIKITKSGTQGIKLFADPKSLLLSDILPRLHPHSEHYPATDQLYQICHQLLGPARVLMKTGS